MALLFEESYNFPDRTSFLAKVREVASQLYINPNWLMGVMKFESGLNPAAYNANGGASGLIQFMPATATALGTTTALLRAMSGTSQLDYVNLYYWPYKGKLNSFTDLYAVTFYPDLLNHNDNWVFPAYVVSANKIFDLNKDGKLTKGEWKQFLHQHFSAYPELFQAQAGGLTFVGLLSGLLVLNLGAHYYQSPTAFLQGWKELKREIGL